MDDRGDYLDVLIGTKGGRLRRIPIETAEQRAALDHLKQFATSKNGSTIPMTHTFAQWRNRVRWINRSIGFSKKDCGYTPHALRHAYLNDLYEKQTGQPSTVRGGTGEGLTKAAIIDARQRVANDAGHVRISISNAYLGTIVKNPESGRWEKDRGTTSESKTEETE
jgi:integrase